MAILGQMDPNMSLQQLLGRSPGGSPPFRPPGMGGGMGWQTGGALPPMPASGGSVGGGIQPQPPTFSPAPAGTVDLGYGFGDAGNGLQFATPQASGQGSVGQAMGQASMGQASQPLPPVAPPPSAGPSLGAAPATGAALGQAKPPVAPPFQPPSMQPPERQRSQPSPWGGGMSSAFGNQRLSSVIRPQPRPMPPQSQPFQGGFGTQPTMGFSQAGKKRPGNY